MGIPVMNLYFVFTIRFPGPIPRELGAAGTLEELVLLGNGLSGEITFSTPSRY